ncbi:TetR/AcrR family transcriptional regulator [Paenibacillus sp. WQ 127069]|uniref:TetR/AcrR family transcriptional regulator n=1 Tax=Paenibacillus baimaensis TaxID=2982185 RepID=A0ABT2UK76_9BACL|nr:TetR/AcrR family transcriptional regulator [Paenibacillus sp. WQ 127069]MCU6795008.1 TetR/AcrR family transcriptional regulator [Paenibacillus sp. WQ 127069]
MARTVNEKLREERRKQIMDAATAMFSRQGFAESTIKDIAKEAGISHASVFLYFANKEDLFHKVVVEHLDAAKKAYQAELLVEGPPLSKIYALIEGQIERQLKNTSSISLIQYVVGYPERFPALAADLKQFVAEFVDTLIPIIQEAQQLEQIQSGDAYYMAWSWFSYISGIGMCHMEYSEEGSRALVTNGLRIFGPK